MRMELLVVGTYPLTDDLRRREEQYATTDPAECARIDAVTVNQDPEAMRLLLDGCDDVRVKVRAVDPDAAETDSVAAWIASHRDAYSVRTREWTALNDLLAAWRANSPKGRP